MNNYLFYTINDCWKWGTRAEWWKSNQVDERDATSFYEVATGLNYKASANLTDSPGSEVQLDPGRNNRSRTPPVVSSTHVMFGMDAIYTF